MATKNVSTTMGGFTPLFDLVIQDVGLMGAAVFGRMWRYCQGDRGVCQASTETIAQELNISSRSVIRWQQELCDSGYLKDTTPDLKNRPHTYQDTGKVRLQFSMEAVAESHTIDSTTTESQSAMTESHSHYDRESVEETIKETIKETIFTPPSGENTQPQTESVEVDDLFGEPTQQAGPKQTKEERLASLRQAAGADPLTGALKALETASEKSWTVPEVAGGADPWARAVDAFCCLHGMRADSLAEKKRDQWSRKLQAIGEEAQATPDQVVAAIRKLPDTELAFKVPGYTTPYKTSFADDLTMVMMQMACGQLANKNEWSRGL